MPVEFKKIKWDGDKKVFKNNLKNLGQYMYNDSKLLFESAFVAGENQAKSRAPWNDRTGDARRALYGEVTEVENENLVGRLGIRVDYGKYLELANGGKYQIIRPIIHVVKNIIKSGFKRIKIRK